MQWGKRLGKAAEERMGKRIQRQVIDSSGERNGSQQQDSCLENSMRAWQATVHGVTKSQTQLSDFTFFSLLIHSSKEFGCEGGAVIRVEADGKCEIRKSFYFSEGKINTLMLYANFIFYSLYYTYFHMFSQFISVIQSCLTLGDSMDCSMPSITVHHQLWSLLKLISMELVMPSNHLNLSHPLLLLPSIFPSIRVFSNELVLPNRRPKVLHFQLQHQSFQ